MTTATGTSIAGWQVVLANASVTSGILNAFITNAANSEPLEVGYYYVFSQVGGGTNKLLVVDRGIMYAQGIVRVLGSSYFPNPSPGFVGVRWKQSGYPWSFTLA